MAAIILQFVGDNSLGSSLIEWYDHGKYSHVDTVMLDGSLLGARSDSVGGAKPGVQVRHPDYVEKYPNILQVKLPMASSMCTSYYNFLLAQVGKPYDITAIAGFVSGRDWRKSDSWFCSELIAAGLEQSDFVGKLSAPVSKIAPDDLLLVCSALVDL